MKDEEFEQAWADIEDLYFARFGEEFDLQAILLFIGINELGFRPEKLNKDQKIDLMHIAVCRLLEPYGFYQYKGRDQDGWPHYERTEKLPNLNPEEQERLMKEAIISYHAEE
ncbi:MAG: hypothetical protein Kow0075_14890 [Salibacteraceae bacterium]